MEQELIKELTDEDYFKILSNVIFEEITKSLRDRLLGHCMQVRDLPLNVMENVVKRFQNNPPTFTSKIEAYVLSDNPQSPIQISSTKLITRRNDPDLGILIVFIPSGVRVAAEDSFGISTFEEFSARSCLYAYKEKLIKDTPETAISLIKAIAHHSYVRQQPLGDQIIYLSSLQKNGYGKEFIGALFYYLGLIPDLEIPDDAGQIERRITKNSECIGKISNPLESLFQKVDSLGLAPDTIQDELIAFLRKQNIFDIHTWTRKIFFENRPLTFDKWQFKGEVSPEAIEIRFKSLTDILEQEGQNLIAKTNRKYKIKWTVNPRNPESLNHFVMIGWRNDDALFSARIGGRRKQYTLNLRDITEGPCQLEIQAMTRSNDMLAKDLSDPFWIETGEEYEPPPEVEEKPFGDEVRSRYNALFHSTYTRRSRGIKGGELAIDEERTKWTSSIKRKDAPLDIFRIRLTNGDMYHIKVNPLLREIENLNLENANSPGSWLLDLLEKPMAESTFLKTQQAKVMINLKSWKNFLSARQDLFRLIKEQDPFAVVETTDLLKIKDGILQYAQTYLKLLQESVKRQPNRKFDSLLCSSEVLSIDTILLRFQAAGKEREAILMLPTHPLKILWFLQYQQLIKNWANGITEVKPDQLTSLISQESVNLISSLNYPATISTEKGKIFVNIENLTFYWPVFAPSPIEDMRGFIAQIQRLFGFRAKSEELTGIGSQQLSEKVKRYLKQHPYVSSLKLNVLHPGSGQIILDTLRILQDDPECEDYRYDLRFLGSEKYDELAYAFDDLMDEEMEGSRKEIDEAFLTVSGNSLFPKLTFSKHTLKQIQSEKLNFESNITIILDHFQSNINTIKYPSSGTGSFLHGLVNEYLTHFSTNGGKVRWSRHVRPTPCPELFTGDTCAHLLFESLLNQQFVVASVFEGKSGDKRIPSLQLELSGDDQRLIARVHEISDWVFIVDRNFGIEYLDNPVDEYCEYYLIDYIPEFLTNVGHRLIISTQSLSEIEHILQPATRALTQSEETFITEKTLNILRSISGKLVLKLLSSSTKAKEAVSLALAKLFLQEQGKLQSGIIIPMDSHIDLLTSRKKDDPLRELSMERADLVLVNYKGKGDIINFDLVEVKIRTGDIVALLKMKEELKAKLKETQDALIHHFAPREPDRIDRIIKNKELINLLEFYLERAKRYEPLRSKEIRDMCKGIEKIKENKFRLKFSKYAVVFHLEGSGYEVEDAQPYGYKIYYLGRDKIADLLHILKEEIPVMEKVTPLAPEAPKPEITEKAPKVEKRTKPKKLLKKAARKLEEKRETRPAMEIKPEEKVIKGEKLEIILGENIDTKKPVFWAPYREIPKKLPNQHILIVGLTGAGKTQTIMAIVYELWKQGVPSLILDFHGEYIDEGSSNFRTLTNAKVVETSRGIPINPLEVPLDPFNNQPCDYMKVVFEVSESLSKIFGLGDIQKRILKRSINQVYLEAGFTRDPKTWASASPDFTRLWENLERREIIEGGSVRNLVARVEPIFESDVFRGPQEMSFDELTSRVTVIRLSDLFNNELRVAVSRFLLQKIYSNMLTKGQSRKSRIFCVVDEAHKLSYDESLTILIKEARKYGVGIILSSQETVDFHPSIFSNTGTTIALQLETKDAKVIAEHFGLISNDDKNLLLDLIIHQNVGEAVIRNNHYEPYAPAKIKLFYERSIR